MNGPLDGLSPGLTAQRLIVLSLVLFGLYLAAVALADSMRLAWVVAAILAYWRGSPIRPEFGNFVLITALFMVIAMWIFPEAGGKKRAPKSEA